MSMLKISSKPISSPSRSDKFPTPLMMRFLRGNVGSRSRGRSRSSPMFIMRTKKNAAVISDTAQPEPSSPKVTCIGQVRARRSSKVKSSKSKRRSAKQVSRHSCSCSCPCPSSSSSSSCCCCIPKTRFCCRFRPKFRKPKSFFRAFFRKWVLFFRFGYCKKIDVRDDAVQVVSIQRGRSHVSSSFSNAVDIEVHEGSVQETKEDFLESSCPPKNALLLTRCRSAPYRSSSLAGRFWGCPLEASEAGTEAPKDDEFQEPPDGGSMKPNSPNDGKEVAVDSSPRNSSSHEGSSEELDSSSNERTKDVSIQNSTGGSGSIHPLLLTRCKSEPARTGERLNPEVNFTMQRRSDTTQSCLQESNCN